MPFLSRPSSPTGELFQSERTIEGGRPSGLITFFATAGISRLPWSIQVTYGSVCVGNFIADMVAEEIVLIENKAVINLAPAHEAQLVNYLTATGIEIGLLFNFGSERLQFKRKHRTYKPKDRQDDRMGRIPGGASRSDSSIL